jgi:glycosyltransferase involved in cell wall biosynthesis
VRRIEALIDETSPDLLHCHNIYHQLTPSIIGAAKRRGVPVVLTLHDSKPVCPTYLRLRHGAPCSECVDRGFGRVLANRCAEGSLAKSAILYAEAVVQQFLGNYEQVDAFIAPSEFMRESVTRRRFSRDRVVVIPNGVDTQRIAPCHDDDGYVLYLGRLSAEKGIETLLEAHRPLKDTVQLRVAGTGPLEDTLRTRHGDVTFLGHLTGAELESAISRAGILVAPSNCFENCPMSVLGAMAYGKPVIGSAMGGIPELIADGETGFLFPAGYVAALRARIIELMSDPAKRRAFGAAGRARVEAKFSLDRHNTELMALYRRVLDGARGRAE